MSKKLYEEMNISDIASAIREKNGSNNQYTVAQMAGAVRAIETQPKLQEKSITTNGEYTPDAGFDGFSKVTANVPNTYVAADEGKVVSNGALKVQTNSTVNQNGVVDTTEIKQVIVNVPSSGGSAILVEKNISSNGTYNALIDDDADGYSEVIVDVPSSGEGAMVRPKYQGLSYVYVASNGADMYRQTIKDQYLNIFETEKNHVYCLCLGQTVGARRRASFFENLTFEELAPYLDSQPQVTEKIYSNGRRLAPFQYEIDDTGNALAGRIIFMSNGGLVAYGTDNAGKEVPALCFDLGSLTEKKIEYIEASPVNTQYFDIGVRMASTIFYEVDLCQVSAPKGENFFLGSLSGIYNEIKASNTEYTVYVNSSDSILQHSNDRHKIKVYDGKLFFDDTKVKDVSMGGSTSNMFLFSRSAAGNQPTGYGSNIRIYGLKIWDGASLIREFHPVKFHNEYFSVCALYDSVTETYLYPLGDTGLLAGPVLN